MMNNKSKSSNQISYDVNGNYKSKYYKYNSNNSTNDKDYFSLYKKYKNKYLSLKKNSKIKQSLSGGAALVAEEAVAQVPVVQAVAQAPEANWSTRLNDFINLSRTRPADYWGYYMDQTATRNQNGDIINRHIDMYEYYEKSHPNTYRDSLFQLVNEDQINEMIPIVTGIYNEIQPNTTDRHLIKSVVSQNSDVAYFGDYHSSLHALIDNIEDLNNRGFFIQENGVNTWRLQDNKYLVFLGDLVDRGPYGVECLYLLYILFIINNQDGYKVFIVNGNHEEENVHRNKGFGYELGYQIRTSNIRRNFEQLIAKLPIVLFLKSDADGSQWYQFCHGGIDKTQHQNSNVVLDFLNDDAVNYLNIARERQPGFLFSDFTSRDGNNRIMANRPIYQKDLVDSITRRLNIKTIISGHQDMINYGVVLRPGVADGNDFVWDNDFYKQNTDYGLKTLRQILNANVNQSGNFDLDMNQVSAVIISSSTIAKMLKFSIYGILNLNTDVSHIKWLPACNTDYINALAVGRPAQPNQRCNEHLQLAAAQPQQEAVVQEETKSN